jgi:hypothetical protein
MKIIENKVITFIWRVAESEQKAVPQIRTLRDRSSHTGTPGQKRTATSGAPDSAPETAPANEDQHARRAN